MSVLFCPFCEESFEGLTQCPEHELELVAFDKLKSRLDEDAQRERTSDEKPIDALHPGYMRGPVALGAVTTAVGFFLPFIEFQLGDQLATASAYSFALERALNLWTPLGVAIAQLAVLATRRTPSAMQSARLTIPLLSCVGGASIAYTAQRVFAQVDAQGSAGHAASAQLLVGAFMMIAGLAFSGVSGLRFGSPGRDSADTE
ncbi:MAG: hypothetical protein IPG17_12930 [Sandaracinaceae bacterium]|nr:hypothetical protein [Sandaracinaceae bacterium]MBP7682731.1 hypothetical protein [Deltaproteobacteria bacterium]MBK6809019.1 hypothetical protein [Sandaracinaceae bacterium]MBK7153441.1 hypothetical protein [Sandaracinaceae bacterium]MBK7772653.1 hypothetical protein [Sandaracinaceae bacterium]